MKLKNNYIPVVFVLVLLLSGCNKYLEVTPKSSLSEAELFESEIGFKQALSGVYSTLATRDLYGDNLSMGFVSAIAQNYATRIPGGLFADSRTYKYESDEVVGHLGKIWKSSYTAIAAANNIIAFSETNKSVLSQDQYRIIRGEAFALRAYLHFELLRLFGYSFEVGKDQKAIPYKTEINQYSNIPGTTEEVINQSLEDVEVALELLKDVDPIFLGTMDRAIKLNYYAVKGLEARIRLYKKDENGAYLAAKEVVESGKFPFVKNTAVTAPAGTKDRLFRSELVFALRVRELKKWAEDQYFKFSMNWDLRLTRGAADFDNLYETGAGNSTDIRYNHWLEDSFGFKYPSKFWQTYSSSSSDSTRLDQFVPLIRITEMYYIMAETAPTLNESLELMNKVRNARSLPALMPIALTKEYIENEILKEYQKEFFAEGQLFYYYKRKNATKIKFLNDDFDPKNYKMPIPDAELEFNPNY